MKVRHRSLVSAEGSESVKKLASPLMDLFAQYAGQLSASLTDIQREITFTRTVVLSTRGE